MTTPPYFGSEIEQTVSAIGAKVAKARAERGWSLQQLARRAGLSPASIHKIEKSGMTPTIASLMKIAAALGRSVSFFVEEAATPDVNVIRHDERAKVYTSKQGLDLRKAGDFDGATAKLGRAVQLASVSGNADTAKLLAKVVDVVDAATGTVRLKTRVAEADEMTLETRSTKTVRVKK